VVEKLDVPGVDTNLQNPENQDHIRESQRCEPVYRPNESLVTARIRLQPLLRLGDDFLGKKIISSEYTFIDVGANFGAWSFPLAAHFSKVLAVEPDRRCYECCQKTLRDSGLSNIDFSNVALADSDRDGLLFASSAHSAHIGDSRIYDPGDTDRMTGTQVKLLSFDSLVSRYNVNTGHMFIKLDAQGAEPLILQGMSKALNSANDVILFTEIMPDILAEADLTIQEYLDLLRQMGFSPVDLGNELERIEWEKVHASLTHDRSTKDYCFRSLK